MASPERDEIRLLAEEIGEEYLFDINSQFPHGLADVVDTVLRRRLVLVDAVSLPLAGELRVGPRKEKP